MIVCELCGNPIDDPKTAYQQVAGWERPGRGMGGQSGSSLVLREHIGPLAHDVCVTAKMHGLHVQQGALL